MGASSASFRQELARTVFVVSSWRSLRCGPLHFLSLIALIAWFWRFHVRFRFFCRRADCPRYGSDGPMASHRRLGSTNRRRASARGRRLTERRSDDQIDSSARRAPCQSQRVDDDQQLFEIVSPGFEGLGSGLAMSLLELRGFRQDGQVACRVCIIRLDFKRSPKMCDPFRNLAHGPQSDAQIVVGVRVVWIDG